MGQVRDRIPWWFTMIGAWLTLVATGAIVGAAIGFAIWVVCHVA